jgi:pimeloyl-ACP methyl ester carboxylesterase
LLGLGSEKPGELSLEAQPRVLLDDALADCIDAVCKRLDKTRVAVFGHSWGSALGVLYAARFPEKVAVYVGSGQYGDAAAGEAASYEYALAEAQRRGKRRALG